MPKSAIPIPDQRIGGLADVVAPRTYAIGSTQSASSQQGNTDRRRARRRVAWMAAAEPSGGCAQRARAWHFGAAFRCPTAREARRKADRLSQKPLAGNRFR